MDNPFHRNQKGPLPNPIPLCIEKVMWNRVHFDLTFPAISPMAFVGYYRLVVLIGNGNFGASDTKLFSIAWNGRVVDQIVDPQPVIEYRLQVRYPLQGQEETRVKVARVRDDEKVGFFDRSPNTLAGEFRSERIALNPGETYKLVLVDSARNGMPGGYAYVSMYVDGALTQNLAYISGEEFRFKGREDFVVPYFASTTRTTATQLSRAGNLRGKSIENSCEDKNETFVLRGEEHKCDWIALYWPQSSSFCDLDIVEHACRQTCGKCGVEDDDDDDEDGGE